MQFTELQLRNKILFEQNQKELLWLANTEAGRHLLGIKEKEPIIKVTPNGIFFFLSWEKQGLALLKAKLFCYEKMVKHLLPFLSYEEILKKDYNLRFKDELEKYKGFLHFNELENYPKFPRLLLALDTFYSGAGDGSTTHSNVGDTWTQIREAASALYYVQHTDSGRLDAVSATYTTEYAIGRSFFPVDASDVPDDADVSGIDFKVYAAIQNDLQDTLVALILTTQASTSEVVAGDFNNLTLNSPDEGATRINLTDWSTGSWQTFALNATGIGWVSLTGWTKLGLRNSYDVDNTTPAQYNQLNVSFSESANDPTLEVTYTVPAVGGGMVMMI